MNNMHTKVMRFGTALMLSQRYSRLLGGLTRTRHVAELLWKLHARSESSQEIALRHSRTEVGGC